jgi:hypothetical protein
MKNDKAAEPVVEGWLRPSQTSRPMNDSKPAKPVYDNYEISPCVRRSDGGEPYVDVAEAHETPDFWTLYGHISGQGVEAIGDFATREAAEEVYYRITGQPFTASYEADARLRMMHAAPELAKSLVELLDGFDRLFISRTNYGALLSAFQGERFAVAIREDALAALRAADPAAASVFPDTEVAKYGPLPFDPYRLHFLDGSTKNIQPHDTYTYEISGTVYYVHDDGYRYFLDDHGTLMATTVCGDKEFPASEFVFKPLTEPERQRIMAGLTQPENEAQRTSPGEIARDEQPRGSEAKRGPEEKRSR